MTTTATQLAAQLAAAFTHTTRPDDSTFRALAPNSPPWMSDAIRAAHDDASILPDDWRYATIEEAADAMATNPSDIDQTRNDFADNVTPYTSDLLTWLASSPRRVSYVDEATDDFGYGGGIIGQITRGQYLERLEVWDQLAAFLADEATRQSATGDDAAA